MARYDLNAILKEMDKSKVRDENAEIALDDVSRVKVLSPGRQVLKRFMRNRLAVFGFCLLATMFIMAFLGPLVYPYGQKQVFYKYDAQTINYAMAKENSSYTAFAADPSAQVEKSVSTMVNSTIRKMLGAGTETAMMTGEEKVYFLEKITDEIFSLEESDAERVALFGTGVEPIGTYSQISKTITFAGKTVPGLEEYFKANVTGNSGTFEFNGDTYSYGKGSQPKTISITLPFDGVLYTGDDLDEGFEAALAAAAGSADEFSYNGKSYYLQANGSAYTVYAVGSSRPVQIYSRLSADSYETGGKVSEELICAVLMAGEQGGPVTAEGRTWNVSIDGDALIITDDAGREFAEMSPFTVRRYSGEDSMSYDLKKAVAGAIEDMVAAGKKETVLVHDIPKQDENGKYVYDEAGNLEHEEGELHITQREVGSYVITADQTIFLIDRYADPSRAHFLGTDGDGFDVFSRIMYGGRVSLMVGFVVVFLEILLGVIMGGLAGYYGGWVDMVIMRLVDVFYCLPSLPIMIILGAMMDAVRMDTYMRLIIMMAALGVMGWAGVARMVRGQILSLREQEFMVATEATGIKVRNRIFRHLVPNVMPQLIVIATMGMGSVILTESTLSFLGLGVKHPLATWGSMINSVSSASAMAHYAYIWIPVGLLICLTVIAFNFVGDGLRDAYDPKAKR